MKVPAFDIEREKEIFIDTKKDFGSGCLLVDYCANSARQHSVKARQHSVKMSTVYLLYLSKLLETVTTVDVATQVPLLCLNQQSLFLLP